MGNQVVFELESPEIKYLCRKDKRLAKVISIVGPICASTHNDGYDFLVHEIIEQMMSIKAGKCIYDRLQTMCNSVVTMEAIDALSDDQIRSAGMSYGKVSYIRNLNEALKNKSLSLSSLTAMTDEEVISSLVKIKGIGTWTAKMYLMFVLGRMNVLPYEDGAFLQSYRWLYKTTDCTPSSIKHRCAKWAPYASLASRYMYRALDIGLTRSEFHLHKDISANKA